ECVGGDVSRPFPPASPAELRAQLVVPFAFFTFNANPPINEPQLTPPSFNKSPMFLPAICTWFRVGAEHTSPMGSGSPTTVNDPLPPSVSLPVPVLTCDNPLVCPATRFNNPGVDGPKTVSYELSLIAKFCA